MPSVEGRHLDLRQASLVSERSTPYNPAMSDPAADSALAAWLPRFPAATVLVLGDIMLDRYVHGAVRRISPEAPIPVLLAEGRRGVLGGAGNVAQNIAALGANVALVGIVGADAAAEEIGDILRASPTVAATLVRTPDRPTTVKTRFVSGSHQLLRLDEEIVHPIGADTERQVLAALRRRPGHCRRGGDLGLRQGPAHRRRAGARDRPGPRRRADGGGRSQTHRPRRLCPGGRADPERRRTGARDLAAGGERCRCRRRRCPRPGARRGRGVAGEAFGTRADPGATERAGAASADAGARGRRRIRRR